MRATLVTCSFRGDLDVCRLLARSVDLYADGDVEHRLYVPQRDLPLFADLATPRRRVLTQESLLPAWFLKAPLPGPAWRRRLGLPRRNLYLTPFGPVRGWIAQQIMKISASLVAEGDLVAHVDSDAAFLQPFSAADFTLDGVARLYAGPVGEKLPGHALWYDAAARLLGLPAADYYTSDYIGSLVVWRRAVVEAMTARIEATTGKSWRRALASTPHFSEYVLYGVFAEAGAHGVARDDRSLCLSRWADDFGDPAAVAAFLAEASAEHLVCCLQSTLDVSLRARARMYKDAARAVAASRAKEDAAAAA